MPGPAPLLSTLLLLASVPPGPMPPAPLLPIQYVIETPSGGSLLPDPRLLLPPVGLAGPPAVTVLPGLSRPAGTPVLPSSGVAGSSLPPPGSSSLPIAVVPTPQLAWRRPG